MVDAYPVLASDALNALAIILSVMYASLLAVNMRYIFTPTLRFQQYHTPEI